MRLYCLLGLYLVRAAAQDAEACQDPPLLSRFPGCRIESCEVKDYDAAAFLVGTRPDQSEVLAEQEGELIRVFYHCPSNVSALQILRNAETALVAAGYQVLFRGRDSRSERALTIRQAQQWIGLRTSNDDFRYEVLALKSRPMAQHMLAAALAESGVARLDGIEFDFNSARLRPESRPVLEQIVSLLNADPNLRLEIGGHTDAAGDPSTNRQLSLERASAVKSWLVAQGIVAQRLTVQGYGDTRPLAPQDEPANAARNRRVELRRL